VLELFAPIFILYYISPISRVKINGNNVDLFVPTSTFQTRLPESLYPFLEALGYCYGTVERQLNSRLESGESFEQLEKEFQLKFGLDSQSLRNIRDNLKGKRFSRAECLKKEIIYLEERIKESEKYLKKLNKKLNQSLKRLKKASDIQEREREHKNLVSLKRSIHFKKRKIGTLTNRRRSRKQILASGRLPITFGGRKLLAAQHNLEANGYSSHAEWLEDWRESRNTNILMVGSKRFDCGNQLCRLNTQGNLKITVPPCLQQQFGTHQEVSAIFFRYGQAHINAALFPKRYESVSQKTGKGAGRIGTLMPVTHRFVKKDGKWYLFTTVELPEIPYQTSKRNGALGVDLNPTSIDWVLIDGEGNLRASGSINLNIQDKSTHQTKDILGKACAELVRIAKRELSPIVVEKLDFSQKKASLKERSIKYARMLSNFAYSSFATILEGACLRSGIELIKVNPAYSSLIGLTRYMSLYGLNSGTAAAMVLARRALRFSERVPRALHNALKKPVDSFRHVWSAWSVISRSLETKGATARHQFYTTRKIRGANSSSEVTPTTLHGSRQGLSASSSE
jgi:IS605 OrfB family transposase